MKFIIKADYNNIVLSIKSNNFNDKLSNIFLYIIMCAINKLLSDKQFFTLILLFINCNLMLEDIGSHYYILYLLGRISDDYSLSKAHVFKILHCKSRETKLNRLYLTFNKSPLNKLIIEKHELNNSFTSDLLNSITKIVSYIASHKITQYSNNLFPPVDDLASFIQQEEILNRLSYLKNIMSIRLLKFLGVDIITTEQFLLYDHLEKYEYYVSCVEQINYSIKQMLIMTDEYTTLAKEIGHCNNIIKQIL